MVLAAAPTLASSLGRRLEVASATVTSAAAPAVAWSGSQPSGPRQSLEPSQTGSKKYGIIRHWVSEMEGGQSTIGLLIIDSSCTLSVGNSHIRLSHTLTMYLHAWLALQLAKYILPLSDFRDSQLSYLPLPGLGIGFWLGIGLALGTDLWFGFEFSFFSQYYSKLLPQGSH